MDLRNAWNQLSRLDAAALVLLLVGGGLWIADMQGGIFKFLKFLALLSAVYLLFHLMALGRSRLLWSLRNRLIVAYLFSVVVPILLVVILAVLAGQFLYSQLGSYLLTEDIQRRIALIADIGEHIAAAHGSLPTGVTQEESEDILAAQSHAIHDRELPGLTIEFSDDLTLLRKLAGPNRDSFSGLMQQEGTLSLVSVRRIESSKNPRVVQLRVPVKPEFLASIAPDLGAIQINLMRVHLGGNASGVIYSTGSAQYETAGQIVAHNRTLQPPELWVDSAVNVVSRLPDSVFVPKEGGVDRARPVFAVFSARPSKLNGRMFASLGELRDYYLFRLGGFAILFLLIEIAAFSTGLVLTRRITRAVADLYTATQFVKSGDWTHRVRIERRDQLGVLGESFNEMTESISGLIEEQKQRQRLQNEISIAREVQDQLFPSSLPSVPGVEIEAICKAARSVSGDYYDFIQLSPTHLAIAIADISGKGISAALLMASLQAALRSQVLADGSEKLSTAELVSRLNKHLVRNTGDDRFATFFIAVYDSATRTLRYTNAGHLPSFLISRNSVVHLDKGGMVLGVVEDYIYEEGCVTVHPESVLVGYSDGLVEPENVYGEEFGIRRLEQAAIRVQDSSPRAVAEALMAAAEEWAGTPEQADDMTVIVTRLK
ncbi:MAG TPA: PP2C family protein-serine/threonine phosphatase [Candidatus Acidoferrum sp.]|jgi:sigma-B regulation protein RsbU (phosphoserine phosphatase)